MRKTRLVLIDSNAIVHRAYHALPALSNKKGELLNAVYGFSLILINMIRDLKPTHIIAAFDVKAKTFRHKIFKEYKAKRIKKPEEFYEQFPKIKAVLEAFDIPIIEKNGYEADDIIATVAKYAINSVDEIIIVTGDMDSLTLVSDSSIRGKADIKVWAMKQGLTKIEIYDEKKAYERYGFDPKLLAEYKGLRGDASDNIPGVAGIGEKSASQLIEKYNTLENIYKNINKIPERQSKLLTAQKDQAMLSRELGKLDDSAPIEFKIEDAKFQIANRQKIVEIFQEFEFTSLINKIPKAKGKNLNLFSALKEPNHKNKYHLVSNQKELSELIHNLSNAKFIAFDVETDCLDMITGRLLGISFAWAKNQACYVDLTKNKDFLAKLKPILENSTIKKIGHNIKYDWSLLYRYGIDVEPLYFDTMLASYLLNTQSRAHNLDDTAFIELGYEMQSIEELIGHGKNQKSLDSVPVEKLAQYSSEDSDIAFQLFEKFAPRIKSEGLSKLFESIEMPLVKVLGQMELNGIILDKKVLARLNKKVSFQISNLKSQIFKHAGSEFNINSTQQLRKILFEDLKISTQNIKRTKTGHSTAATELEKLKGEHIIIDLIHQYRELIKIKNTYLDALPKLINPKTGRLHTSFNQTITTSGRLSSSEPNLQNIPIRTPLGTEIRRAFVADKGLSIVAFDYSQIELRVAAHFSDDSKMIEAFEKGSDIHSATAALIFNKPIPKITKSERRIAKTVNFGILYGISPYGLAQNLGIERQRGQELIDRYFKSFPKIKKYCEKTIQDVGKSCYVETLFGHKRYLPDINSSVVNFRNAAERMAINHPIQGTAAEIMKMAMIELGSLVSQNDCRLLLQVHDELVFEISKNKIKKHAQKIKNIMENVVKLKVPIEVDMEIGRNWGELK